MTLTVVLECFVYIAYHTTYPVAILEIVYREAYSYINIYIYCNLSSFTTCFLRGGGCALSPLLKSRMLMIVKVLHLMKS